jgi:hypothetical protein
MEYYKEGKHETTRAFLQRSPGGSLSAAGFFGKGRTAALRPGYREQQLRTG